MRQALSLAFSVKVMHPKEKPSVSRRGSARILVASAFLLAAAALLLVLSILESGRLPTLRGRNGFRLEGGEKIFYAQAGNGLAAATTEHIQLFSSGGKCAAKMPVDMTDPACAGSSLVGVYYDVGQEGIIALYPDGSVRQAQTEGPVVYADVNETGLVTVLLEKRGYKGCVMVYDTDLSPLFRWDAGSGYPLTAHISREDVLCVNCAAEGGSALRFFRIDREAEQAAFSSPGELILDFGFLSDGTVCAVTENRMLFLRPDGTLSAEHDFAGEHLDAFWLRGDFAVLATVTGRSGGSALLTTLDSRGGVLGQRRTDRDVTALSAAGEKVLVLFSGRESTLYSSALEEDVSFQPEEDVKQIFLFSDYRALFGGAEQVRRIDFSR